MKKFFSISLIIIGLGMCLFSFYPILEMNKEVGNSLDEWEEVKQYYVLQNEEIERYIITDDLIGTLTLVGFNDKIPIL